MLFHKIQDLIFQFELVIAKSKPLTVYCGYCGLNSHIAIQSLTFALHPANVPVVYLVFSFVRFYV